ncbi:MAG: HlyD family type I secretion periplasmic adaptor subunit [Devosia sp.]
MAGSTLDAGLPSDSVRGAVRLGIIVVAGFFGVFGGWAALSPLDGAIVSEGVVTVEGNRKSVDHLDGGTVTEIRVKEGDHVAAGDVLVIFDDIQPRAQRELYAQQLAVARALEARLAAELEGAANIQFPPDMLASDAAAFVKAAVASQIGEFDARKVALAGAHQVLQHQVDERLGDLEGKQQAHTALLSEQAALQKEVATLAGLLERGLTTRGRLADLQREAARLDGQIADSLAAIASGRDNIAEIRQQMEQLDNERRAELAGQLNATQAHILDLGPSLANAVKTLERSTVRAPYAGKIVGLRVFSTGAVVAPGGTILDIVPDDTGLVIDARVRVDDISDLKMGADAEVHLTSYRQIYVPVMRGEVTNISADRLTDARTGMGYYVAQIVVDPADIAANQNIVLYPGMPAQVMIITERRSALEYLVGPLFAAFGGAFRQN